jgi:inorganic pyrophosphatase
MIIPGAMVIFSPLVIGVLFGPKAICGYLVGVIVSGVQLAISSSNSGGAWDNAKKFIEGGKLKVGKCDEEYLKDDSEIKKEILELTESIHKIEKKKNPKYEKKDITYEVYTKGTKPHKAAVIGDTFGDPLKDTSGPSLNILIKLSAIISLIFGSFFAQHAIFNF